MASTKIRKSILIFSDRGRMNFPALADAGVEIFWAATIREARDEFERRTALNAVIVELKEGVERGLEFCEIVHVTRPAVAIVFVRSAQRPSLAPHCAHRVLDPETNASDLEGEILLLLENAPAPSDRRSA